MQKIISTNNMKESSLKKLSKSQLIKLLLQQNVELQSRKPIPAPRKSVKQMVQDYEDNIILPPTPKPRNKKPTPLPRTKIEQVDKALKGYTKSYEIVIKNNKDPLAQLQNTRKAIEYHIIKILTSMKGLKFVETLRVTFKKLAKDEIVYKTAYFNSKPQTIINNTEIPEALQLSKQQILNMIAQWVSEGSGWTVESVDNHYLNILQYQPMKGSSYIKLPQELRNSAKGLINMKNEDNECFRWCHIRHLNPQNKDPQRIKKSDKKPRCGCNRALKLTVTHTVRLRFCYFLIFTQTPVQFVKRDIVTAVVYCYITTEFHFAKRDSRCLSFLGFSPCKWWQALAYLSKYLIHIPSLTSMSPRIHLNCLIPQGIFAYVQLN